MSGYDCDCMACSNDDAPDVHEICKCLECHDAGCHDIAADWSADCEWCEEAVNARANDLQKGDAQ